MTISFNLSQRSLNRIGNFFDMYPESEAQSENFIATVNTAASGTQIQWTRTAGGTALEFISPPIGAGGFTLSGTMNFQINAYENSMNANIGARARVFKYSGGSETEVGGGPWDDGVEFGSTVGTYGNFAWTGTPSSTSFAEDDRIIVRFYITNIGTMAGGFTGVMRFGPRTGGGAEPSFSINESPTFKKTDASQFGDPIRWSVTSHQPITNPINGPSQTVAVGELVIILVNELNANTATTCSDGLGNTYTPLTGGTNGTRNLKAWYSLITTAGTAAIQVAMTASANSCHCAFASFKGPFASSPLDQNPAVTTDSAEPYTGPATGTLAQAAELVLAYYSGGNGQECYGSGTPSGTDVVINNPGLISSTQACCIARYLPSDTSSITPTISAEPGGAQPTVCGVATFKMESAPSTPQVINVTMGQSVARSGLLGKTIKPTLVQSIEMLWQVGHRVPLSQSQSAVVIRSIGKQRFFVTQGQLVSSLRSRAANKILPVVQGQSILLRRSAGKLVNITQAQAVTDIQSIGKLVPETMGQSVTLTKSIGKRILETMGQVVALVTEFIAGGGDVFVQVINATQSQTMTLLRSIGKLIIAVTGQIQVITLIKFTGQFLQVVQSQVVTLRRAIGKLITIVQNQVVLLAISKALSKIISVVTGQTVLLVVSKALSAIISVVQAQVVTLRRSIGKLIIVIQGQLQVVTLVKFVGQFLQVVQSQVVTLRRSIGKLITTVVQGQAVSLVASKALNKILNIVQGQVASLRRSIGKLIVVGQSQSILLNNFKSFLRTITIGQGQLVTLLKSAGRRIIVTQAQVVSLVRSKAANKIINVVQAQVVTLRTSFGKLISVIQAQLVVDRANVGKIIQVFQAQSILFSTGGPLTFQRVYSVTQAQSVTVLRAINRRVVVLMDETALLLKSVGKRFAVVTNNVESLIRSKAANKLFNITQAQLVTLRRSIGKLISVAQGQLQVVTLVKFVGQFLQIVQSQSVTVLRSIGKRVIETMGQVVSVFLVKAKNQILSVVTGQVVSLRRRAGKVIFVSLDNSVTMVRRVGKRIVVTTVNVVSLTKEGLGASFQVVVNVVTIQVVSLVTFVINIFRRPTLARSRTSSVVDARRPGDIVARRPGDAMMRRPENTD